MYKTLISSLALIAVATAPITLAPFTQAANAQTLTTEGVATTEPGFHSAWSELLGKYISASDDGINRFDYGALKANTADNAALNAYVESFATLDIPSLSEAEQYVAWVNLYNAGTVQYIIGKYPTKTIKTSLFGPWKKIFVTANGAEISLNDIEHEVLRKQWSEPRTHYAVNCASFGCPNLKASAWEVATLEEDLTQAARDYINHPRGVSIRRDGRLEVSTIYKWFKEDFGRSEENVIAHFLEYADADLAARINARPDIKSYEYDWALNDTN